MLLPSDSKCDDIFHETVTYGIQSSEELRLDLVHRWSPATVQLLNYLGDLNDPRTGTGPGIILYRAAKNEELRLKYIHI